MGPTRGKPIRRSWWGLGGGAAGVIVSATLPYIHVPRTGAEVHANALPLPSGVALALLILGSGVAIGWATIQATAKLAWPEPARRRFAIGCGLVAAFCAAANLYLMYQPGPDWWYSTTTMSASGPLSVREVIRPRNPYLVNLVVTFVVSGFAGALVSGFVLRVSLVRFVALALTWPIAFGLGALLTWFGSYLIAQNTMYVAQELSLGAPLGRIIGVFVAGFLAGYVTAFLSSLALPTEAPQPSMADAPTGTS